MTRLVIFDDRLRGVDLPDRAVVIGRSARVDIPIRDAILSRKHCSIVPTDDGFRLFDLESQNGTFVNGARVENVELEFDDVIEIGNTVLVFLDTETWQRGEGLTRLRHPVKAQELIQRLNRRQPFDVVAVRSNEDSIVGSVRTGAGDGPAAGAMNGKRSRPPDAVAEAAGAAGAADAAIVDVELLTDFVLHEYAKRLLEASPELLPVVARSVRELCADRSLPADHARLRALARRRVEEALGSLARARGEGCRPAGVDRPEGR